MSPRRLAGAALTAGAVGAACGGGAPPPSADGFGPVRTVSEATGNGATPMYLMAPDGTRVLAWISAEGGGVDGRLHLAVTDPGTGRTERADLADRLGPIEPHGESPPQLGADAGGAIYVQYTVGKEVPGERFPRSALRLVRSDDRGKHWSDPVTVNEGEAFGSHNFHALLVGAGGRLYSSWLGAAAPGGPSLVWLRRSPDAGRTWLPTQLLHAEATCPCCRTALALGPGGVLYAAWRKVFPGDVRDIVVARSRDDGVSWDPPVKPQDDGWVYPGCPHAGPSLRVDAAGAVHIAWWTGKEGRAGVFYARSTDQGQHFAVVPLAVAARSVPVHVQLGLGPAGPVVVWDDGFAPAPRVLLRAATDGGASFGEPLAVSPAGEAGSFPVVQVSGDSIRVAWSGLPVEAHHAEAEERAGRDPKAPMGLPRVGGQVIRERVAPLAEVGRRR